MGEDFDSCHCPSATAASAFLISVDYELAVENRVEVEGSTLAHDFHELYRVRDGRPLPSLFRSFLEASVVTFPITLFEALAIC